MGIKDGSDNQKDSKDRQENVQAERGSSSTQNHGDGGQGSSTPHESARSRNPHSCVPGEKEPPGAGSRY
jgi:hypothetical protein